MGGCRCFFRHCRDAERSKQWIAYGKLEYMLEYPASKQKNVIVCARHFRDECFMNYKKDRLSQRAVPTISRLSKDKALDYELDLENGVLITLPETQMKHLIPPEGFECTLGLENDENVLEKLRELENPVDCDEIKVLNGDMFAKVTENEFESNISTSPVTLNRSLIKRPLKVIRNDEEVEPSCSKKIRIDQVPLPQGTIIELESPTIINHQIIGADGNVWIEHESYNIAETNNDGDFEFIEVQSILTNVCREEEAETNNSLATVKANDEILNNLHLELNLIKKENATLKEELERSRNSFEEDNRKLKEKYEQEIENKYARYCDEIESLRTNLDFMEKENAKNKKKIENIQKLSQVSAGKLKEQYEQQMENERAKYVSKENKLLERIKSLQDDLETARTELLETKHNIESVTKDLENSQTRNRQLIEKQLRNELLEQGLKQKHDELDVKYQLLLKSHEELQKSNIKLKDDCTKLENQLQNQVSTITTTDPQPPAVAKPPTTPSASTLTKAQLFNGIKRYISSSMMALLRMEMFGNSDREWKTDERQVAVDILRLGENVYKYFTDEWRFRLPGLRDAKTWLSQSVQLDDEEDL
ncbi:shootin-1-like [Musca vetustissima]|uniref:shootin-1-like n=1 Tax=Musca vetustissima TaxID=27455 RepID=UPI002AB64254|nr:shootin-1-like [Musca vetustissima]